MPLNPPTVHPAIDSSPPQVNYVHLLLNHLGCFGSIHSDSLRSSGLRSFLYVTDRVC